MTVNAALSVDVTLQVGQVTQAVTVTSTVVHVDTTSTQMGEVIGSNKMTEVPLLTRGYTDLLALQPGVVPVSSGMAGGQAESSPPRDRHCSGLWRPQCGQPLCRRNAESATAFC